MNLNLVIDIGNTLIKTAVFNDFELIEVNTDVPESGSHVALAKRYQNSIGTAIISSVAPIPKPIAEWINAQAIYALELNANTPLPFENTYNTLDTLGKDRIAAVAGAWHRFPNQNVLIIDAGTAITYEVLTADGRYLGGNISPGIRMRYKALNTFTARLPLLNNVKDTGLIGSSTQSAIENGVQNGAVYEMRALIDELSTEFNKLCVVLTGGDAQLFENKLKKAIFVLSNLTLEGLNIILKHNAEKF